MAPTSRHPQPSGSDTVRAILAARGFSLAEISRQSRLRFSGNSLFRIPSNFYDALHHVSFSPSLHQLFALSVLTGYRLADWLSVFGFSFDAAARFQASWSRHQTTELDARVYDPSAEISWFEETQPVSWGDQPTPLSQWLAGKTTQPLDSLTSRTEPAFRYLKIGSGDAYAYPDLLPESVVRIDPRVSAEQLLNEDHAGRILAIEHSRGILCSRVRPSENGRVILCSKQVPYPPVELRLDTEARILGVVDLEIRPLAYRGAPEVSNRAVRHWIPSVLTARVARGRIGEHIRRARNRSGLSFHEASERTREIAQVLRHPNYFCAASALSDIEGRDFFPRHVHKLISLSAVYSLSIGELAGLAGLVLENAGQEVMPEEWKGAPRSRGPVEGQAPSHFLQAIQDKFEEIPYFLRSALPSLLSLPHLSLRDLFWAGATSHFVHPYLRNSAFLAVNRKSKTPTPSPSSPVWAQPLYVLEMRDGSRLCAACSLQNGTLLIRPCTSSARNLIRLRNRVDAEVLGKVVALVRRLGV
jgi:hypothetical protein